MHIFENQILMYENVLTYRTDMNFDDTSRMIRFIQENTDALNIKICGRIVMTVHGRKHISDTEVSDIEFLIPIDKSINPTTSFGFKPVFKLVNAVRIRYEGNLRNIRQTVDILNKYILDNNLITVTEPYFSFVKSDMYNETEDIIDIYIGINQNIL